MTKVSIFNCGIVQFFFVLFFSRVLCGSNKTQYFSLHPHFDEEKKFNKKHAQTYFKDFTALSFRTDFQHHSGIGDSRNDKLF